MIISSTLLSKNVDFIAVFDSLYFAVILVLLFIVLMPFFSTLMNIVNQTDEVLKLKRAAAAAASNTTEYKNSKRRLSLSEAYTFIYGKNTPLHKAIFASFY